MPTMNQNPLEPSSSRQRFLDTLRWIPSTVLLVFIIQSGLLQGSGMRGAGIRDVAAAADPDGRVPAGPAFLGPESTTLFSGIATYGKTFELPESLSKRNRLFLELGDLAEIAEVTINGKRLGFARLPPYRIEISGAIQAGTNQLEIRVANLWANRLNGDSLRPESTRFTRSNLDRIQTDPTSDSSYGRVPRGKTRPVYSGIPPLMKSGLLGPVRIITPRN